MPKVRPERVNKALTDQIYAELREMKTRNSKGDFVHPLAERMKVIDRALKLEAIKQKADNPDFGTAFADDPEEDDE